MNSEFAGGMAVEFLKDIEDETTSKGRVLTSFLLEGHLILVVALETSRRICEVRATDCTLLPH